MKQELWKCLRRIMDKWSASHQHREEDSRNNRRNAICLPALLQPCVEGVPTSKEPVFVVTEDISEEGVAVIAHQPMEPSSIILVIWHEGPTYFLGDVRQCHHLGGGYWKVGVQLTELISSAESPELRAWAERLSPEAEWL